TETAVFSIRLLPSSFRRIAADLEDARARVAVRRQDDESQLPCLYRCRQPVDALPLVVSFLGRDDAPVTVLRSRLQAIRAHRLRLRAADHGGVRAVARGERELTSEPGVEGEVDRAERHRALPGERQALRQRLARAAPPLVRRDLGTGLRV